MQALINNTWNADYDIQKKIILIILTSCPKLKSTGQKTPIIVLSNSNIVYMSENCVPAPDLLGQY